VSVSMGEKVLDNPDFLKEESNKLLLIALL